jgi:hypothetical protein
VPAFDLRSAFPLEGSRAGVETGGLLLEGRYSGRSPREIGPIADLVPDFPLAGGFAAALRVKSEAKGATDFTPMWSGQSGRLARELPAKEITQPLASENARETQFVMTFRHLA